ncbi:MAG: response regulator [Candidatus Eisenbacteria bacterium]
MVSSRILLVEDDPDLAEYLAGPLEEEGYEVSVAADSAAAIADARRRSPDVILVDLAVRNREAFRFLDRSRIFPEIASAPKVAMTAWGTVREKKECARAGVSYFLEKPVDRAHLVSVVSSLLAKIR